MDNLHLHEALLHANRLKVEGNLSLKRAKVISLRWADIKGRLTLKNWDEKIGKRMRRLITLENAHIKTLDDEASIWTHEGKYSLVGLRVVEFSSTAPNSPTERQQWLRGQYAHKPLLKLPGLMIVCGCGTCFAHSGDATALTALPEVGI